MLNIPIFFGVFILLTFNTWAKQFSYEIESMGACDGPEFENIESPFTNLVFKKINRTAKTLSYNVIWLRPLDDKVGITITVAKMTNTGLKKIPFLPVLANPCKILLKNFNTLWVPMMKNFGVKHPDKCPIPAGNYSLKNFVFNSAFKTSTGVPMEGTFVVRTILSELATKKIVSCSECITKSTIN